MSTLNKVFAKFSAQEPMKVEFASVQEVDSEYNRLLSEMKSQRALMSQLLAKFENAKGEMNRTAQMAARLLQTSKQVEKDAQELGIKSPFKDFSARNLENERSMTIMMMDKFKS